MGNSRKRCLWLGWECKKDPPGAPGRVYLGDEGCPLFLIDPELAARIKRLLSRQCTDPALAGFRRPAPDRVVLDGGGAALLRHCPPPNALWERWQTPPVFSPGALAAYRAAIGGGPMRVEVDLPPHGLPEAGPDCAVTVHTGEVLVSESACAGACGQCPRERVLLGETRAGVDIYRRRNSVFYHWDAGHVPIWCDREVRHA